MSAGEDLNLELSGIFKQLVAHTKERDEKTADQAKDRDEKVNQRMDKLADSVTQSNIEIATLAKIVARSEERHLNQQEGMERLGNELTEFIRQQTIFNANSDDRVMDVEKQNIKLKIQGDNVRDKIKVFNKWAMGIISIVLAAALVGWLVVKPTLQASPAVTTDSIKIGKVT